jgi:hypothetical protein
MSANAKSGQIELALFGQKIVLKHRAQDPELAAAAAGLVTQKVKDAQSRVGKGSAPHHIAVIALLDLAAEYLQAKSRTEELLRDFDAKSGELKRLIDEAMK